jgi:hypothetical protein
MPINLVKIPAKGATPQPSFVSSYVPPADIAALIAGLPAASRPAAGAETFAWTLFNYPNRIIPKGSVLLTNLFGYAIPRTVRDLVARLPEHERINLMPAITGADTPATLVSVLEGSGPLVAHLAKL